MNRYTIASMYRQAKGNQNQMMIAILSEFDKLVYDSMTEKIAYIELLQVMSAITFHNPLSILPALKSQSSFDHFFDHKIPQSTEEWTRQIHKLVKADKPCYKGNVSNYTVLKMIMDMMSWIDEEKCTLFCDVLEKLRKLNNTETVQEKEGGYFETD
jgi:hypothetical protein